MYKRIFLIIGLIISLMSVSAALAQQTYTEQDAINLATDSLAFKDSLENYPGWTAAAYDTQNAYGIWHVQLWSADGDDLGWADVSPARSKVYSWESHVGASDGLRTQAEPVLKAFIDSQPEVTELVQNPSEYIGWFDYNGWNQSWGVYVDRGSDSLYVLVQFDGKVPTSFENPHLLSVSFPEVLSYDDWQSTKKAVAIATAFKNPDIANTLSGVDNWTTSIDQQDDDVWQVSFVSGDNTLAQVTVNLKTNEVVDSHVGG